MSMVSLILCLVLILVVNILFFLASNKQSWDVFSGSSFECGFTSYFFSHFSFSIHYFLVALIFLFLDLELCFIMPFLNNTLSNLFHQNLLIFFTVLLVSTLIYEWKMGKLEWIF